MNAGDVVTGTTIGNVTLSVSDQGTTSGNPRNLVLYNSTCNGASGVSCTGGDGDLASGPGTPFNTPAQGNVLIIEENSLDDPVANPDDSRFGGTFIFSFLKPVFLETVTLLDVDDNPRGADIDFTYDFLNGSSLTEDALDAIPVTGTAQGDNSLLTFTTNQVPVTQFEISFPGSGAVASLTYSVVPLPAGAWLMLTGLGAMGFAARRRRKS